MSQIINCRFKRYALPSGACWLKRRLLPFCKQLGLPYLREEKVCQITTDYPEVFLNREQSFTIRGSTLGTGDDVELIPLKWTIGYDDAHRVQIQIRARELGRSPFDCWFAALPDVAQVGIAIIVVEIVALIFGLGSYVILAYPDPDWFWGWVARNIRATVGLGLPVLIIVAGTWLQNQYEGEVFLQRLAFAVTIFLWPFVALAWFLWAAAPMTTESYAEYLGGLRSNAAVVATLFVGLSPWLVIILKALGLELLASGTKKGSEQIKSWNIKSDL
jgi:hypothetical protein